MVGAVGLWNELIQNNLENNISFSFFVPLPDKDKFIKVFIYTYILLSKDVSSARLY